MEAARNSGRPGWQWTWRVVAVVGVVLAAHAAKNDFRTVRALARTPQWGYPAERIHTAIGPELAAGRARLVLFQFPVGRNNPRTDGINLYKGYGIKLHDRYYTWRLSHTDRLTTVEELNGVLGEGKPVVLVLPPGLPPDRLAAEGLSMPPDRSLLARSDLYAYPVLTFHGAEARLNLGELLGQVEVPPEKAFRP